MEFYTIITDAGRAAVADAIATGGKVDLVQLAAGDGGGQAVQPVPSQQALAGEVWRGELSTYTVDGDVLTLSSFIPAEAMAFTLREMGAFTADGMLFAVCNTPEIRHVPPEEGVVGDLTLGMQLKISTLEQDALTIQTNPDLDFIPNREKGAAGGVAPLGPDGKVPEENLPETDAFTNDEILDEETATDIGLGPGAVPADMFNVLAHIGDVHVWRRTVTLSQPGYSLSSEKSDGTLANGDSPGYTNVRLDYGDSITVSPNGDITINNKTSTTVSATGSAINVTNKFIHIIDYNGNGSGNPEYANSDFPIGTILFVTGSMVISGSRIYVTKYKTVTSYKAGTTIDYPISINRNAYQEGSDAKPGKVVKGAIETGQITLVDGANGKYVRLEYATSVTVDDKANIIFSSPENANITYGTSDSEVQAILRGKYIRVLSIDENPGNPTLSDFQIGKVYFIPSDTTSTTDSQHGIVYLNKRQSVTAVAAIPAGTTIEYLGNLGDKSRVQYTSYVGTGAFGSSSPNSLTFRFAPKVVLFESGSHPEYSFSGYVVGPYVYGAKAFLVSKGSVSGINAVTVSGNTIKWSGEDADRQLNRAGLKYYVVAIG